MKDETQPYKYFGDCVDHCYESVVIVVNLDFLIYLFA